MIRSRINYWSCSRFADWVRGEKKPLALGLDEWGEWHEDVRVKKPFRHYLAEEVLDGFQNFFYFPLDVYRTVRAYLDNRFVHKTHCLKTGLEPGKFHELGDRFLYGLFNELKEFVEVDLGMTYAVWDKDKGFRPKGGRCPEAGVAHLEWAKELRLDESHGMKRRDKGYGKPTRQALVAVEILELYKWWEERGLRPDPGEVSGWRELAVGENKENSNDRKRMAAYRKMESIEKKYRKEDERMMVRLVRIRDDLWT